MPEFSERSEKNLKTCHPLLQKLFRQVVKTFDCTVIEGRRGEERQQRFFEEGKSNARFGESPHNWGESFAADVVPYPVDWEDTDRFFFFAGFVLGTAKEMGIDIKWGGDWDRDFHLADNRFDDFPHFELADWRQRAGVK